MSARTPAVVVTFFPDADFGVRLAAIAREASPVLVFDNSADPAVRGRLEELRTDVAFELTVFERNLGLGAALNAGFAALVARGHRAAFAFDQDSTPAPGFAAAAETAAAAHGAAVVGANWHDEARPELAARHLRAHPRWPFLFARVSATQDLPDVTCVITSGACFNLGVWRELGGFDAGLFLDLVDTDYCLRAAEAGHRIAVAAAARLAHRRGAKRPVRRFGRTWWPAFMPPRRLHLLFRNRLLVAARTGWRRPHWLGFEAVYAAKIVAEVLALEDNKAAKLGACLRGTWDGLLGFEWPPSSF